MTVKYLSIGGIIVDDIVFPDGRTAMNALGGGGVYTVAGMRLWSPEVGLWGRVGPDFEPQWLDDLAMAESLIQTNEKPTPRAWQLYETDGTRTQIPRVSADVWKTQLMPTSLDLPSLVGTQGVHLSTRGYEEELSVMADLAQAGLTISLEPIVTAETPPHQREVMLECLSMAHIFSPGEGDAHLLLGEQSGRDLLPQLAARGPRLIALRQGATGSTVYDGQTQTYWQVPATPAQVVDVTGGGNAYCGGFLVGWLEHGQVAPAAACAAVSAALTIEQVGPPALTAARLAEAERRLDESLPKVVEID